MKEGIRDLSSSNLMEKDLGKGAARRPKGLEWREGGREGKSRRKSQQ